ncbi:TPA: ATPase, T2SS/T4P/T4SS family [Vibrio cholerae]|uniref:CpaF family protein n=1 Tax=Vibrio cholerae TaxID=666 RepID=UPI0005B2FCFF|nr:ATPase, T2SS/T4P/T4SS family [Vibrio cholerae]EKF9078751.1 CpaF family protein [Vibrio cholerae]MVB87016.1 CpaF family protein [Vibrio cholerae]MVF39503.1 CpaF family protein [Vibrio cholerae]NOF30742.1 CpaF family protein [Vibrio cholerae]HDI3352287.1 CpaF family protein [Vibrio cholerae]
MSDFVQTIFGLVPKDKEYEWTWVEQHFGKLRDLYETAGVTEIFVDRFDRVSIEKNGRIELTDVKFESEAKFVDLINQVSVALNQEFNAENPILDARLPDCSRLCCTLPQVTPQGATMTLRIAPKEHIQLEKLVEYNALTDEMYEYLVDVIKQGKNILVSGNTGSGKTTLLRALSRYIPVNERVAICEDTQELYIDWLPFKIAMEAPHRKDSFIDMAKLIETSLRVRPDRIWVGEIRKPSAADAFLQAINTGHSGCATTLHANSCDDAVSRLQYLIASQGNISFELAKKQIVDNVDVFIQASRHFSYGRKITEIKEVRQGELVNMFHFDKVKMKHVSNKLT